jgi:ArsR family transcriptional regulator, arsenate/arsenite/antimonite-responsive transcriptional repressor
MLNYLPSNPDQAEAAQAPTPDLERLAANAKVLADPRRLSILDMLMEGVQCNCEIAERLGVSLSLISYHLHILAEVGLVRSERDPSDARWVYYEVNAEALQALSQDLAALLDVTRIKPRKPNCGPKVCDTC